MYNETHQARLAAPTNFESLLGDAIERAFASGHWELDALTASLNASGPSLPGGGPWTPDSFTQTMAQLGVKQMHAQILPAFHRPGHNAGLTCLKAPNSVDDVLERGLKDRWYPVCPSSFVGVQPVALERLGYRIVLWRDAQGQVQALEDRCPHRGAALSQGVNLGNRLACPYHGVEVQHDGVVARVPGSPGCPLEGAKATRRFHAKEAAGAVFLFNALDAHLPEAPSFYLPEELGAEVPSSEANAAWDSFLCYVEWAGDYRYVIDNVMDPMHGAYLHRQSHTMAEGDFTAEFQARQTDYGFVFEKKDQRNVNFDWTEWMDRGIQWMRLEIPYPKTAGPGGSFTIIGAYTPINTQASAVFFWRCRKVVDWQRDTWRFLYKNRLEARHWNVLEQDRAAIEQMVPYALKRERLYVHDGGLARIRRAMARLAQDELARISKDPKLENPGKRAAV